MFFLIFVFEICSLKNFQISFQLPKSVRGIFNLIPLTFLAFSRIAKSNDIGWIFLNDDLLNNKYYYNFSILLLHYHNRHTFSFENFLKFAIIESFLIKKHT